ncbi:MAG: hypothetical protein ACK5X3_12965 [Pseudomonadota bacterium]|jgi:hypothetical protein
MTTPPEKPSVELRRYAQRIERMNASTGVHTWYGCKKCGKPTRGGQDNCHICLYDEADRMEREEGGRG